MTKNQSFLVALSSNITMVLAVSKFFWIPLMVVLLILPGLNLLPKGSAWLLIPGYIALAAVYLAITAWAQRLRESHIREAPFPRFLKAKLLKAYPHLTSKDYD